MTASRIVVIGVSAVGKSTVAQLIASALGASFVDADDLHPAGNHAKMSAGIPLNDEDRMPWLDRVAEELAAPARKGVVIACSALRRRYRDRIRYTNPGAVFVHLHGDSDLLMSRSADRKDHFMPSSLMSSQIATLELLEADESGVMLDVAPPAAVIAGNALEWLAQLKS